MKLAKGQYMAGSEEGEVGEETEPLPIVMGSQSVETLFVLDGSSELLLG